MFPRTLAPALPGTLTGRVIAYRSGLIKPYVVANILTSPMPSQMAPVSEELTGTGTPTQA
jgi:hypothetical protein